MPLPFILAAAAVAAGGYGVAKGIDAYDDNQEAKSVNKKAQKKVDSAESKVKRARNATQNEIEKLGRLKFRLYENAILPFVNTFSQIKNLKHNDKFAGADSLPSMSANDFKLMKKEAVELETLVGGGVASLGAGGLAGLAAYGGVGTLATASTGTAIGTLSGAAATNATLAWLGGGSLAAGGYGMAGGMMVLGGIVAGPVLAVGGAVFAAKAREAKENAYANLKLAEKAAAEMKLATTKTKALGKHFQEMSSVLSEIESLFLPQLGFLQSIVRISTDYKTYSETEKQGVFFTAALAKTLKNLLEVDMLTQKGVATAKSKKAMREARKSLL